MAASDRRHEELDRYLLDGERLVTAVHQHWGKVAEPVGTAILGCVVALWVDAHVDPALGILSTAVWWAWFAVVGRMAFMLAQWRHDWFVATDKRLLLFYGFITRKVSMMPLMKVTDMSYERSVPGRILGYGRFVMESAGQDQALREVNWVPEPDEHYRAICSQIFGVADHARSDVDEFGGEYGGEYGGGGHRGDHRWAAKQPQPRGIPDPYAGWDDPRHSPRQPSPASEEPTDTLYRSPDLRARDRSAETGPIPIRPRRDWDQD